MVSYPQSQVVERICAKKRISLFKKFVGQKRRTTLGFIAGELDLRCSGVTVLNIFQISRITDTPKTWIVNVKTTRSLFCGLRFDAVVARFCILPSLLFHHLERGNSREKLIHCVRRFPGPGSQHRFFSKDIH